MSSLRTDDNLLSQIDWRPFPNNLPEVTLHAFAGIAHASFYPPGARLFVEGQTPRGVFILCSGRAKLTITARNGKSLMRVAEPGEILGLSAIVSGHSHEGSAEMLDGGEVNFISQPAFLNFLRECGNASLLVAQHLSRDYYAVFGQMKSLALSDSAGEKLAHLLLHWCARNGIETEHGIHLKLSLTHGEIAQMISASRETVTRLFSEMRNKQVIHLKGSSLVIRNKAALESMVNP
jgi:CRP/FNR family transcriptional regulator